MRDLVIDPNLLFDVQVLTWSSAPAIWYTPFMSSRVYILFAGINFILNGKYCYFISRQLKLLVLLGIYLHLV